MQKSTFVHVTDVRTTPAAMWSALADADRMKQLLQTTAVDVVPNRRMVWLVTESTLTWFRDQSEWTNTKMVVEITTSGDKTILHFTHDGLVPENECYAMCAQGWDKVIKDRLFHFITAGKAI